MGRKKTEIIYSRRANRLLLLKRQIALSQNIMFRNNAIVERKISDSERNIPRFNTSSILRVPKFFVDQTVTILTITNINKLLVNYLHFMYVNAELLQGTHLSSYIRCNGILDVSMILFPTVIAAYSNLSQSLSKQLSK